VWLAVAGDWRTAPLSPQLRATLGFLEKQTLRPEDLTREDAEAVYAAGVSRAALETAVTVCGLFNMIVRLADAFGWDVPTDERLAMRAPAMLEGGYLLGAIRSR
jgi:alkylhydroperoxidase family enzyme